MAKSKQATSTASDATNGEPKQRKPKGPELTWNAARRTALATAVVSGVASTTAELATLLAADPAFAGVEPGVITAGKVRLQLANQRKALAEAGVGVDVPKLGRSRGEGIDVAGLAAIYGGGGAQPSQ